MWESCDARNICSNLCRHISRSAINVGKSRNPSIGCFCWRRDGGLAVARQTARQHYSTGRILLAGGSGSLGISADGGISQGSGNQLVRTREAYAARGFAVLVPDSGFDLAALVEYMAKIKRPVAVVGTSRGTQRAARGLAAGARPDRLVLTSGFLSNESGDSDNVMNILGSPDALPPTLVVHHHEDGCSKTAPAGVAPFIAWAHGKARVTWLNGGTADGDVCQAQSHHGFAGIDGQVVSVVSGFIR